jgi:hypothetical protein
MKKKIAYIIISLILLIGIVVLYNKQKVSIYKQFSKKIVYTTDSMANQEKLKKDCDKKGGTFSTCGSICDDSSGPVGCPAVCAFTCELR